MFGKLKFIVLYLLSWIAIFQIARLTFLLYHSRQSSLLSFDVIAQTFFYGLRMDLSITAYLLMPVCLFLLLSVYFVFFKQVTLYKIYTGIVLFFVLIISTIDLEIYKQWGFRIDATPLKYLSSPKEAWASISHLPVVKTSLFFIIVFVLLFFAFNRLIKRRIAWVQQSENKVIATLYLFVFAGLMIVAIRGGTQQTPMNQSSVYFSTISYANHAATNATWNFMQGVVEREAMPVNPYQYLPGNHAKSIADSLYKVSGKFETVLNTIRPNIIFIVWESFTKKVLSTSINGKAVTPNFNRLKNEGLYFNNVYASGDRTDKGLSAILSGYPALPQHSILRDINKAAKLPSINSFFKDKGYATPFYYGGEPEFGNIKSYLLNSGFDPIVEKRHFAAKDRNSKWGAHDGVVAERLKTDLKKATQPFMATWLTLSSHEPFETPVPTVFAGDDEITLFLNSMHYTDAVLNDFIKYCRQQTWWHNTLIIIVADHGHPLPATSNFEDNFKIPVLWLGGALKNKPATNNKLMSQIDIAATLCAQLSTEKNVFPFSRNVFDTTAHKWAFFSFNDGWGFIQPGKTILYDNVGKQIIKQNGDILRKDIEAGKALQQYTYQDYLDK